MRLISLCLHRNRTWPHGSTQTCLDCGRKRLYTIGQPPGPWRTTLPGDRHRQQSSAGERHDMNKLRKFIPRLLLWLFSVAAVLAVGCAVNKAYTIHPGSISIGNDGGAFDSRTADFLSEEKAFLDSFNNKHEPQPVMAALAQAQQQYIVTKAAYLTWRAAQTAAALADLNNQKTQLTNAVGGVATAQKGSGQ